MILRSHPVEGITECSYLGSTFRGALHSSGDFYEVVPGYDGATPFVRIGLGGTLYYHVDPQRNVTTLHNGIAALEGYYYEPFGEPRDLATGGDPVGASAYGNELFFQAKIADTSVGFSWLDSRFYDPMGAHFLSRDPIGETGGLNLYAYANSNPLRWRDPTGLAPKDIGDAVDFSDSIFSGRGSHVARAGSPIEIMDAFLREWTRTETRHVLMNDEILESGVKGDFLGLGTLDKLRVLSAFVSSQEGETDESIVETRSWARDVALRLSMAASFLEARDVLFSLDPVGEATALAGRDLNLDPGQVAAVRNAVEVVQYFHTGGVRKIGRELAGHAKQIGRDARDLLRRGAPVGKTIGGHSLDDLSRAAAASDRNRLTRAARHLQKHGDRGGAFPQLSGTAAERNAAAQAVVDDILTSPQAAFRERDHPVFGEILDIRLPDGRGVRYGSDGAFLHFLEP